MEYMRKNKKRILLAEYPLGLFFTTTTSIVFTPLFLIYSDVADSEFTLSVSALLVIFLFCIFTFVLSSALKFILPKISIIINSLFNGIAAYLMVTVIFIPVHRGILDGRESTISQSDQIIHICLFIVFISISIISMYKRKINSLYSKVINTLGFFTILASIYMGLGAISLSDANILSEQWKKSTALSPKGNIVVICLDMVQQDFAKSYFEDNQQAKILFDGFIFFTNTASASPYTSLSMGSLIRGGVFEGKSREYPPDNLINDMVGYGYDISGSEKFFGPQEHTGTTIPNTGILSAVDETKALLLLGLNRYYPFKLREAEKAEFGNISKTDQRESYEMLISSLHIDKNISKRMLWFHTLQTHSPVRFTKDGVFSFDLTPDDVQGEISDALTMTGRLLEKLKNLNIYDDTLILIISDHGFVYLNQMKTLNHEQQYLLHQISTQTPNKRLVGQYQPLMMIKPPNSYGVLKYNNSAVSLLDIRYTLNKFISHGALQNISGINILNYDQNPEERITPVFVFMGDKFESKDFFSTENWQVRELKMPFQKYYGNPSNSAQ